MDNPWEQPSDPLKDILRATQQLKTSMRPTTLVMTMEDYNTYVKSGVIGIAENVTFFDESDIARVLL